MEKVAIGKLVATHGIKGHLILLHELGAITALPGLKAIMISSGHSGTLPYFITEAKGRSTTETILLLEEIDTKEHAAKLIGKTVSIPTADFDRLVDKKSPLGLVGFGIINDGKWLGDIENVVEQPHQMIASLTVQGREVLIPLHDKTIVSIDRNARKIVVSLPEGLLDIYLA